METQWILGYTSIWTTPGIRTISSPPIDQLGSQNPGQTSSADFSKKRFPITVHVFEKHG